MLAVAFSGGKDSTALALRLAEQGVPFVLLHTATGNELPPLREHVLRVAEMTGAELVEPEHPTLDELIAEFGALPNWRMRWCTRVIKIESCSRWIKETPGVELAVGLRADEEARAGGTYDVPSTYPLRDWGWDEAAVRQYCRDRGVQVPERTDCAVCFYQRLHEWHDLYANWRPWWEHGKKLEREIGHTFRSAQRDTWPASLEGLQVEFERGRIPKPRRRRTMCRVCAL